MPRFENLGKLQDQTKQASSVEPLTENVKTEKHKLGISNFERFVSEILSSVECGLWPVTGGLLADFRHFQFFCELSV